MYLHVHFLKGNQNENVQGTFEQKNNNARLTEYSDAKTEDDSHFFTYFTVITLACLAGYIGYHNKQKVSLIHSYFYLVFMTIINVFLNDFLIKYFFYTSDTCYCIRGSKIKK